MNGRLPILWLAVLHALAAALCTIESSVALERPNVILLLADDLGWNGLRCYGSDLHETPHLDRLAAEGVRFTHAYSACTVCSPTRASILTGKSPARLRVTDWIAGFRAPFAKLRIPDWTKRLEHREVTIAEVLRDAGYRTAHVGKWHLGGPEYYPERQGFDINIAGTHRGSPPGGYFLPNKLPLPRAEEGEYLTDHLTDEALRIIEDWKHRPFFLYFSYYTVHTPIQGKPELVEHYKAKVRPDGVHTNPTYAAMVHSLDQSVGRIIAKLEELGIEKRTLILFTSDNGGLTQRFGEPVGITDNYPLRRGKGSAYEGGVRVPLIIKWPGRAEAGSVCPEPVSSIDFYRTILAATGASGDREHNRTVDGANLLPLVDGSQAELPRDALYWHYPHYHPGGDSPYGAVRAGDWKLIEFYENMNLELYHLADDPGEKKNLAESQPEKAAELRSTLHAWRDSIDAQMPTENPDYDPTRARKRGSGRQPPRRSSK